ncbi:hypothetical protein ACFOU2_01565 [Bacillus songklensis]|uniref:DUF4252 domain-containing protein n=1 Tax=Bacillus songklensis TaxID=1069116 RepID=A0ABV8AZK6_9BACI
MVNKLAVFLFIMLLFTPHVMAQNNKNVEVLNIEHNRVIKTVASNPAIQKEGEKYLNRITDIYRKFRVIPNEGYMIKIPLEPSVAIQNQWMNDLVNEVIIIVGEQEEPYLMVFDDENNPRFFTFKGDIDVLLKALNFRS